MDTLEVKGHFLSTYYPSMASVGVLNPIEKGIRWGERRMDTETYLFVVSDSSGCLFSQEFLRVEEDCTLLLEGSFDLWEEVSSAKRECSLEYLPSYLVFDIKISL